MQNRADVMYVLMFTCMCVAAEYKEGRVAKDKQRLQRNCTLIMHYLKKKKKKEKKLWDSVHCPLTFFVLSISGQRAHKRSDKVTLPSLLLITQTLVT